MVSSCLWNRFAT